jgi:hypothetical protein
MLQSMSILLEVPSLVILCGAVACFIISSALGIANVGKDDIGRRILTLIASSLLAIGGFLYLIYAIMSYRAKRKKKGCFGRFIIIVYSFFYFISGVFLTIGSIFLILTAFNHGYALTEHILFVVGLSLLLIAISLNVIIDQVLPVIP